MTHGAPHTLALGLVIVALFSASVARAQATTDHVPPPAPAQAPPSMSDAEMKRVMEMDDNAYVAMLRIDEFERGYGKTADATVWNAQASYGGDFDKLWLRSEGEREAGTTDGRVEALWDHAFASYWDWQLGVRHDFGTAAGHSVPDRNWAAFGVQGVTPYWVSLEATLYLGENNRSAARFRAEYELMLTQRLVLQPELELNLYDRQDRARALAAGFSQAELGLRLRYEIRREFAPYVGIVRSYRRVSEDPFFDSPHVGSETRYVIGVRIWL